MRSHASCLSPNGPNYLKDTDSVSDYGEADLVYNGDGILQAAKEGRLKFLKKLIAAEVDVHYCGPSTGQNALHVAAQYGQLEIAELLIATGVDINASVLSMEMPLCT